MNSNPPGLSETEEVKLESPAAEPIQAIEPAAPESAPAELILPPVDLTEALPEIESESLPVAEEITDTTEAEAAPTPVAESNEAPAETNWLDQDTSSVKTLKRGEIIEGTITATSPTAVMVDIGGKTEGIIPGREL